MSWFSFGKQKNQNILSSDQAQNAVNPTKKRPVLLAILDGWGFNKKTLGNAIRQAHTPTLLMVSQSYPMTLLQASGLAVGLSWGELGNSEVGHLNIGAGRVVQQYRTRILQSISHGDFFDNSALVGAFSHAKQNAGNVNIIGLLTSGTVHADFAHVQALFELASRQQYTKIILHLFLDGKDSGLQEGIELLAKIQDEIQKRGFGAVATVMGRNFAMDRDNNWTLTESAYNVIARAVGQHTVDLEKTIKDFYIQSIFDNKIPPLVLDGNGYSGIKDGDSLIFFNFREDSIRQLYKAFGESGFDKFPTSPSTNLYVCSMTQYLEQQTTPAAFTPPEIKNNLPQILSQNGKKQLHIAETIKYAHVTYFFNGLQNVPYPGEDDVLMESVKDPENVPTMRAHEIATRVREEMDKGTYDFYIINFANADMLAHTGNYDSTLIGVQTIDQALGNLINGVIQHNGILVITSDHGNAESLIYQETGAPESKHNDSPVSFHLIANEYKITKTPEYIAKETSEINGILGDVAPTILSLMGLPQPAEMAGNNLLPILGVSPPNH